MKIRQFIFAVCLVLISASVSFGQWTGTSPSSVYLNSTYAGGSAWVGVGAGATYSQAILAKFHVAQEALVSGTGMTTGPSLGAGNLSIAGASSGFSLWKRTLTVLTDTSTAGNRWLWYNADGNYRL